MIDLENRFSGCRVRDSGLGKRSRYGYTWAPRRVLVVMGLFCVLTVVVNAWTYKYAKIAQN